MTNTQYAIKMNMLQVNSGRQYNLTAGI